MPDVELPRSRTDRPLRALSLGASGRAEPPV